MLTLKISFKKCSRNLLFYSDLLATKTLGLNWLLQKAKKGTLICLDSTMKKKCDCWLVSKQVRVCRSATWPLDVLWHGFWSGNAIMRKMYFTYSKFHWANITGHKVLVPVNIEAWLTLNYGEEWILGIDEKWNWWNSPKNFMAEIHFTPPVPRWEGRERHHC